MASLVGMDCFDIRQSLDSLVLQQDAVPAHGLSSELGYLTCVACALGLDHGDSSDRYIALIVKA